MARHAAASIKAHDPLNSMTSAWEIALQAARNGAADAKVTAGKAVPAATRLLARMAYATSYSISYGVVFPVVLIAKSVPKNNAVVNGMVDGARAASDWVDELKHRGPEPRAIATRMRRPVGRPRKKGTR
jgi:hypothetical protein